ncbi:sirohydrochlorin chelatase [Kitasatospora atroaurantiaca]|uniref:Sirohydrochlorin ferrochelatase n=1 Tax=Kitasatospora atroaurantiaca TaxID=285545 RepID=A0A561ELH0_9ACTN|nr:sirohydrochlorin chelatase [Kitasatospora atroaurantiaca]TWE16467.1 sirohydrochlorin ferrochelatase [Kitasatospora atroaurantiaca]
MYDGRLSAPAPTRTAAGAGSPALLLIAHGSRDPRHAATVDALVVQLRTLRPSLEVATAYLDHCAPRIPQVVSRLDGAPAVAVPLLLGRAFHARSDIPAALREAGADLPLADVLGPSPLLLDALDRRLAEAEAGLDVGSAAVRSRTGVVLAAAGSSDRAANAATRAVAAEWQRTRGWAAVEVAYASATPPHVPDAIAALRARGVRRVAVAPYLLAPGLLPDRIASSAGTADLLAPVLGAAPEIAELLLHRYDQARVAVPAAPALTA